MHLLHSRSEHLLVFQVFALLLNFDIESYLLNYQELAVITFVINMRGCIGKISSSALFSLQYGTIPGVVWLIYEINYC